MCTLQEEAREHAPAAVATKLSLMPQDWVCYLGRSAWGLKRTADEVLLCWVLCPPLLLVTGEQSGFKM